MSDHFQMKAQKDKWPLLDDYHGCWPVISVVKLALKYKSEAARRTKERTTHKRIQEMARGGKGKA